jgi:hypothetical protein
MEGFSAITPGSDLSRHARELVRVHDAVMGGRRAAVPPRAVVQRSWTRMLRLGLDPGGHNTRAVLPRSEVERRRHDSPLGLVIGDLRQVLTGVADASHFLMVVTDADGVILWREGAAQVRLRADALGFTEGAVWTEQRVGTNAIGTALAEAAPVQLFSAEHFELSQHPWYCTAAPIHDPRTGRLLGVVDVSGPALTLHPAIGALVESAVRLAEAQLWRRHEERLERLRKSAEHVLATLRGPVLVVDDHGWVAHHSGIAAQERIAAPRADVPVAVPGLGLCLPERLTNGWLVRPRPQGHRVTARLDLTCEPVLDLVTEDDSWRTSLTRRHSEILVLMAEAGARGLSAADLSRALFGDPDHVVTVRAEVSRMRRVLGALVAANPYRLAAEVDLTVHRPD